MKSAKVKPLDIFALYGIPGTIYFFYIADKLIYALARVLMHMLQRTV